MQKKQQKETKVHYKLIATIVSLYSKWELWMDSLGRKKNSEPEHHSQFGNIAYIQLYLDKSNSQGQEKFVRISEISTYRTHTWKEDFASKVDTNSFDNPNFFSNSIKTQRLPHFFQKREKFFQRYHMSSFDEWCECTCR